MTEKENNGIMLKKSQLIASAVVVVFLMIGGITLGLNWNNWFGNHPNTQQTEIDPDAKDYEGFKKKDDGGKAKGIAIPGYPSIQLPYGTKDVKITLLNPEDNPCYFVFEIILKEGNESLYTSKQVPPGKAVTDITLSRALKPGKYEATIKINTFSLEDQSPMNGANVETVIIVK